jgi:hypothetical protein
MAEIVTDAAVFGPVFILLAIAAVAVAIAERRARTTYVAAGAPLPPSGHYELGPAQTLARIEAGRAARHPLAWLGLAAGTLVIAFTATGRGLFADSLMPDVLLPIFVPLLLGLFATLHLGAGRDRHNGMDELARTLPTGARTRTVGHLLAAGTIALPLGLAAIATVLALLGPDRTVDGWTPGPLELAQPAIAMLIVGALAVAAGRWWRHPTAGFLVPLLLFFSPMLWGVALYQRGGPHTAWGTDDYLGTITTTDLTWHLVFLLGYLTLAVAGALARHDRRPAVLAVGLVGLVAMVGGYVIKMPSWFWLA